MINKHTFDRRLYGNMDSILIFENIKSQAGKDKPYRKEGGNSLRINYDSLRSC